MRLGAESQSPRAVLASGNPFHWDGCHGGFRQAVWHMGEWLFFSFGQLACSITWRAWRPGDHVSISMTMGADLPAITQAPGLAAASIIAVRITGHIGYYRLTESHWG